MNTPVFYTTKEHALAAVTKEGYRLKYASEELRADKEVVLAAVKEYGDALEHAVPEVLDKEVVLTAVKEYGGALEHASLEMCADKEVVLAAVKQYGDALQYASEELKNDPFLSRLSKIKSRGARLWLVHVRNAKFKDAYWRMVEAKAISAPTMAAVTAALNIARGRCDRRTHTRRRLLL